MRNTEIFQTLEYRQNDTEVEAHGPYFCYERNTDGTLKKGTKEPWLGEGYYFWDSRISDAKWWGNTVYREKGTGYVVCKTSYDQHSPLLYDMVGVTSMFDSFVDCAEYLKEVRKVKVISFPSVLSYLKKHTSFQHKYKAIRVWPSPLSISTTGISFPGQNKIVLGRADKIQVCFFDKTLLTNPFQIVHREVVEENQTI